MYAVCIHIYIALNILTIVIWEWSGTRTWWIYTHSGVVEASESIAIMRFIFRYICALCSNGEWFFPLWHIHQNVKLMILILIIIICVLCTPYNDVYTLPMYGMIHVCGHIHIYMRCMCALVVAEKPVHKNRKAEKRRERERERKMSRECEYV